MTIDQIRCRCKEGNYFNETLIYEYKWSLKQGGSFDIQWIDTKDRWWSQKFDSYGNPIGRPEHIR